MGSPHYKKLVYFSGKVVTKLFLETNCIRKILQSSIALMVRQKHSGQQIKNCASTLRHYVFIYFFQIFHIQARNLFWVERDIAVLWTKLCSFGNLVPKIAASQGISNLFLFLCTCCQFNINTCCHQFIFSYNLSKFMCWSNLCLW